MNTVQLVALARARGVRLHLTREGELFATGILDPQLRTLLRDNKKKVCKLLRLRNENLPLLAETRIRLHLQAIGMAADEIEIELDRARDDESVRDQLLNAADRTAPVG